MLGFSVQMAIGLLPTLLVFTALVGADERRWQMALGAKPMTPFFAWVLGAVLGICGCEYMQYDHNRNANYNWVIHGCLAEVYLYRDKVDTAHYPTVAPEKDWGD